MVELQYNKHSYANKKKVPFHASWLAGWLTWAGAVKDRFFFNQTPNHPQQKIWKKRKKKTITGRLPRMGHHDEAREAKGVKDQGLMNGRCEL